jgi:hypothetical protein
MQPRLVLGLTSGMLVALAVALVVAVGATPAHAALHKFQANLDEAQAVGTCPSNPPPAGGGGHAVVTFDDVTNVLTWSVTFQNLSGPVTFAHFHRDPDSMIRVDMSPDLTSPMQGSTTLSGGQKAAMETELLTNKWYINIHTAACGNGEIRGQVLPATVGGIAKLPQLEGGAPVAQPASSGTTAWFVAALATGMLAILSGAAVYAWRRSLR